MRSPRATRSTHALAALGVGALLLVAACGGAEESDPTAAGVTRVATQPNGKKADPDTWPLTGLGLADGQSAERPHPVLVLKMDNTPSSAPQVGLGSADLVVEELVEGGMTRLAAFFYSTIPDDAGPVRSMRASDIGIVSPVGADMVTSGAAAVTISRIESAGIDFFAEGDAGFYRSGSRSAPYNLFTDLGDVAQAAEQKKARPPDYLPWGSVEDLAAGQRAGGLDGQLLRRPHHDLGVPRRPLRQRGLLRRRRRRVRAGQRAGAAGAGGRRRLPRPRRQPGARDRAGRQG